MKRLFLLGIMMMAPLVSAPLSAQRTMSVMDFMNIESIQSPRLSPDGKQVLFLRVTSDWKQNKRKAHIWLVSTTGQNLMQLTNGPDGEASPRWAPNSQHIAFLDKRDDDAVRQIYLIPRDGGEAVRLTQHKTNVTDISWLPNGTTLYFVAADPETAEEAKQIKLQNDIFPYDEHYKQEHLWAVDAQTGQVRRITSGDFSVRSYDISADGRTIAFSKARSPLLNDMFDAELWIMKADGSNAQQRTDNNIVENGVRLSPDGQQLLFIATADRLDNTRYEDGDSYYNANLFVMPTSGGQPRLLLQDMPHGVDAAEWAFDSASIYFAANTGVRNQIFKVELVSEALTQMTSGNHSFAGWHYQPVQDRHALSVATAKNPGDISLLSTGGVLEPVTHIFDALADQISLPDVETVHWRGEDGVAIEGLLYLPANHKKGTRYPLVVQTHGGPSASDQFGSFSRTYFMQALTSKGYAVFKTNHRGSTGYGDDFLRDMVGSYFNQAHLDVMKGVDHLIAEGIADPDRLIKMGWSAGGHMTNKLITHTNRFKAAASGAGAINWVSMIAQSDIRLWRTAWFGGSPWQENAPLGTYLEHSPLKDIAKAKTPTLILVGDADVRVPPPQSIAMYHALKSNGVETQLYIAPREPHGWRELRHQLFRINVQLDWFAKHALGQTYIWEKAPDTIGEGEEGTEKITVVPKDARR